MVRRCAVCRAHRVAPGGPDTRHRRRAHERCYRGRVTLGYQAFLKTGVDADLKQDRFQGCSLRFAGQDLELLEGYITPASNAAQLRREGAPCAGNIVLEPPKVSSGCAAVYFAERLKAGGLLFQASWISSSQ